MIQRIFANILEISLTISVVIILICTLLPLLEKKYMAKFKYYLLLGIVVRLLIPFPLTFTNAPIQIDTTQVNQAYENWQASFPSEILISYETETPKENQTNPIASISLLEIGTIIWVVGVLAFFTFHILPYLSYIKSINRWSLNANSQQKIIFAKVIEDLKIRRKVSLNRCKIIKSPMMIKVIHPTVLVPCIEYSDTDLYLIVKHELMHYKRHDIETKVLLFLVQTLYWFNPFVYLLSSKLNEAIEMCCDEHVINGNDFVHKKRYMETIFECSKQQTTGTNVFTTNYNGGIKVMKKRFQNIIDSGSKKKGLVVLALLMVVCLGLSSLVACRSIGAVGKEDKAVQGTSIVKTGLDNAAQEPTKLSKNITGIYAESEPNVKLEETIIKYLEVPEEYFEKTMYYYNYVDLNSDDIDEIFVVVMGPYTSGTGGSTALHILQTNTGMQVNQEFTLIQTPIIISDKVTKGLKEIVVMNSGGGASGNYVVLTSSDGQYETVNEGTVIKGLEEVSGTAIISNDIVKDMEEGKALYLQKN